MITAGVDLGLENVKVVILKDGKVLASKQAPSGGAGRAESADKAWKEALQEARLTAKDVTKVVATGHGKMDVRFANDQVVEPLADARAAAWLYPSAKSVLDVGCDQARAMNFDAKGTVTSLVLNQKCAGGIGMFLNSLARNMGMSIQEISQVSSNGKSNKFTVSERCGCSADMDTHSLMLNGASKKEVIQARLEAAATRLNSLLNEKIALQKDVVLIGGVAHNAALVKALQRRSGINFLIPEQPEYAGALGAALLAAG